MTRDETAETSLRETGPVQQRPATGLQHHVHAQTYHPRIPTPTPTPMSTPARDSGIVHKDGAANAGRTANAASHRRVHFYLVRGKMRFFAGSTANNFILPT